MTPSSPFSQSSINGNGQGSPRCGSINLNQPGEVEFWTQQWGVSEHDLRYAIAAAGESVGDIRDYLGVK